MAGSESTRFHIDRPISRAMRQPAPMLVDMSAVIRMSHDCTALVLIVPVPSPTRTLGLRRAAPHESSLTVGKNGRRRDPKARSSPVANHSTLITFPHANSTHINRSSQATPRMKHSDDDAISSLAAQLTWLSLEYGHAGDGPLPR